MSQQDVVTIFTDGASRGNPGPAAYAYVIKRPGAEDVEEKGRLPNTTNNVAEYTALVRSLEHARRLGAHQLHICTDSELMVKQVQGSYRVKNEGLRPLYEQALDLLDSFDAFTIRHVPRGQNTQADRLCNEALDEGKAKAPLAAKPAKDKAGRIANPSHRPAPALQEHVRDEAIACLASVAAVWARGNPADPKPEQVWDQLWSILEEAGVLRVK